MADIELVIKIPEDTYTHLCNGGNIGASLLIENAIKNGAPLPKGHGDLKDVNSIPNEDRNITVKSLLYPGTIAVAGAITLDEYVNDLPTIIEADTKTDDYYRGAQEEY